MTDNLQKELNLLDLPNDVLEEILSKLTYHEIAENRIVCKEFDRIGKSLLTRGFNSAQKYLEDCTCSIKSQLPRRQSEIMKHPLWDHYYILRIVDCSTSMLTINKFYTEMDYFIFGKVIDEMFRIVRLVAHSKLPKSLQEQEGLLDELKDICYMAKEHLKTIQPIQESFKYNSNSFRSLVEDEVEDNDSKCCETSLPPNFRETEIDSTKTIVSQNLGQNDSEESNIFDIFKPLSYVNHVKLENSISPLIILTYFFGRSLLLKTIKYVNFN